MKRIFAGAAIAILLLAIGIIWVGEKGSRPPEHPITIDVLHDGTYTISGVRFTLKNGYSKVADLGMASNTTTRYLGKDATGDVNSDGRTDRAFLITQELGGTGTFYYLVALLDTPSGKVGTQAVLLGDRIAPQKTSIDSKGVVSVDYADRNVGDSFSTPASVRKSLYLKLDPITLQFGEVGKGSEGASQMTLGMKKWEWVNTIYGYGPEVMPAIANKFTLTFQSDGKFSAGTDCNMVNGRYMVEATAFNFTDMVSTQMFCPNSQEREFTQMLEQTQSYFFTSKGQLIFNLTNNTGSFNFR